MSSERRESSKSSNPFVSEWSGKQKLSSSDFLKVFKKYDRNNDGYIEGKEIDPFLEDLMSEKELDKSDVKALKAFKEHIMEKYDINQDTKIELKELSKILPTEENFLLQFRRKCADLTSVDFMKIWNHYDADGNGYLDSGEIQVVELLRVGDLSVARLVKERARLLQSMYPSACDEDAEWKTVPLTRTRAGIRKFKNLVLNAKPLNK